MRAFWFCTLLVLFGNFALANMASDTLKLYEDDKLFIFDLGVGKPEVKFKDGYDSTDINTSSQIRKFYNSPIYLGSEKENLITKEGIQNAVKKYLSKAIKHQDEYFFNDLDVKESQIKVIYETVGNRVKFYYLKAYSVRSFEKGTFDNFWCHEEYKEYSFVEVNMNGNEIYFKKIKSQK